MYSWNYFVRNAIVKEIDLNLAAQYCDRLLLVHENRVFAWGRVDEVITRDNIRKVYGQPILIERHPVYRCPQVVLLSRLSHVSDRTRQVHVVGGGGMGSDILLNLVHRGYRVSTGVLNRGDSDWQTAQDLGLEIVDVPPFSPVSPESCRKNLEMMVRSDAVILAGIPFGPDNLPNLQTLLAAVEQGIPVIVVEEEPIEARDFTGGAAAGLYRKLVGSIERSSGARLA